MKPKKSSKNQENQLVKPVDPRESNIHKMENYFSLNDEAVLKYWSGVYNVELEDKPTATKKVSYSFSEKVGIDFADTAKRQGFGRLAGSYNKDFEIPRGYVATRLQGDFSIRGGGWEASSPMYPSCLLSIANRRVREGMEADFDKAVKNSVGQLLNIPQIDMELNNIEEKIGISMNTWDVKGVLGAFTIFCQLTQEVQNAWLQKTFNKIIEAYNTVVVAPRSNILNYFIEKRLKNLIESLGDF